MSTQTCDALVRLWSVIHKDKVSNDRFYNLPLKLLLCNVAFSDTSFSGAEWCPPLEKRSEMVWAEWNWTKARIATWKAAGHYSCTSLHVSEGVGPMETSMGETPSSLALGYTKSSRVDNIDTDPLAQPNTQTSWYETCRSQDKSPPISPWAERFLGQ